MKKQFRYQAIKRFDYWDGSLSRTAQEAFKSWIAPVEEENEVFKGGPGAGNQGTPHGYGCRLCWASAQIK